MQNVDAQSQRLVPTPLVDRLQTEFDDHGLRAQFNDNGWS